MPWPKTCSCGCSYTEGEWAMLVCIGRMVDSVDDIELRNCTCGSTIAVEIINASKGDE